MSAARNDRRSFIRTSVQAAAVAATAGLTPALASPAAARAEEPSREVDPGVVAFRWLGTAGWRIDVGGRTVLLDPYLSRYSTGLFSGGFDPRTSLRVDEAAIAAHVGDPEVVLVTHSHWDHFNDVPHIARTFGATVVGTLSTYHLAQSMGVPAGQLSPVRGGEVLAFDGYQVEVVASLHSRNGARSILFPGVHHDELTQRPRRVEDLPEGETLAFQVTVDGGPSVFLMGASDFVARNLVGLDPDVAMIALPSSDATPGYVPRLLEALDRPATVVVVHFDDFERPLVNPPVVAPGSQQRMDDLIRDVRRVAPATRIVVPEYDTSLHF